MNSRPGSTHPDMRQPEERVDEESEESFPASDPPSHTPLSGPQIMRPTPRRGRKSSGTESWQPRRAT